MARKGQQKRVIGINVTEAQWEAVEAAYQKDKKERAALRRRSAVLKKAYPEIRKNDFLLWMLQALCEENNITWPEYTSQQGKRTDLDPDGNS